MPRKVINRRNFREAIGEIPVPNFIRLDEGARILFEDAPIPKKEVGRTKVNGPEYWQYLLDCVDEIFEVNACVAGGCVRDNLLGIQPKDIDIFVPNSLTCTREVHLAELGWGEDKVITGHGYGKKEGFESFACFEFNPASAPCPVQLILMPYEDIESLLSAFDLDICKFAYYNKDIYRTDDAERDVAEKTITYSSPKNGSLEKSFYRAQRIQKHLATQGLTFELKGFEELEKAVVEKKTKESYLDKYVKMMKFAEAYEAKRENPWLVKKDRNGFIEE